MRLRTWSSASSVFLAALLTAPAWGVSSNPALATPGTINYVEGQAFISGKVLGSNSAGTAKLAAGETLTTGKNGKVEILLTPGVFLRVGGNSAVQMISPNLTDTEVGLEKGHAVMEVAELHPQNNLRVAQGDATVRIQKTGLYDFDREERQIRTFEGQAVVEAEGRNVKLKGGREVILGSAPLKAEKFDKQTYESDDLYQWSSLRSAYLAEANVNASSLYAREGYGPWGPGWWGAGWYWDPWFDCYTFIPAGGGIFYSPFGWGFYSPFTVYAAPFYGAYLGGTYYHFGGDVRHWGPGQHYPGSLTFNRQEGIYRGPGTSAGGVHSGFARVPHTFGGTRGARSFGGGALAGGGFHGGGFGGFHGGGGAREGREGGHR